MWSVGVSNLLEVRVPVSPRLAVLMTWGDRANDPDPVDINAQHAKNLNSFTITAADEEWFYLPGSTEPERGQGPWFPLSQQVLPNYTAQSAQASHVRQQVHQRLQGRLGEGIESLDEHGRATLDLIVPN